MNVSRFRTAIVASWLAVAAVASAVAQDRADTDSPRPGWMPRRMALNSTPCLDNRIALMRHGIATDYPTTLA
jgi:hypothetical protein